jgi:hypothetical protein
MTNTTEDSFYGQSEKVDRLEISKETKDKFIEARENDDTQKQLNVMWEIITGDS